MTSSSWISSISYRRCPDGSTYLALFLKDRNKALLYAQIPSWLPGLLSAGTGRRSIGLAYNRLLKGKYPYQKVEGERVRELRRMLHES